MRVLFITHSSSFGSTRYRTLPMLPLLRERGVEAERADLPGGLFARLRLFHAARRFDAVVLAKRLIPSWQFRLLRRWTRRLVFDFDDPIIYRKRGDEVTRSATRERRFRTIVRIADAVTAHNEVTAAMARDFGAGRAEVIVNCVDVARFTPRSQPGDGSVLGWLGTAGNLRNLVEIAPALQGRTLRLVADQAIEIPGVRVQFVPWSLELEPAELQRFDIGLAPLPGDLWAHGNLPSKLLRYMAAGLPSVASRGGAVDTLVRHGENGMLASTLDEWRAHLDLLSRDPELRMRLGRTARETVERGYRPEAAAARWVELFNGLATAGR